MSLDQIALLIGVCAAAPLIGWIVWQAIKHGSSNS